MAGGAGASPNLRSIPEGGRGREPAPVVRALEGGGSGAPPSPSTPGREVFKGASSKTIFLLMRDRRDQQPPGSVLQLRWRSPSATARGWQESAEDRLSRPLPLQQLR